MGRSITTSRTEQQKYKTINFNNILSLMVSACEPKNSILWNQKLKNNFIVDENFVDVEAPDDDDSDAENEEEELSFSLYNPEILRARIIRHLPAKREAVYGTELVLTCLTTVLFPVEIEWFLNGDAIEPTLDGRVYFAEDRRQLVVSYLTHDEEGTIEVIARNRFGSERSRCSLSILKRTRAATDPVLTKSRRKFLSKGD